MTKKLLVTRVAEDEAGIVADAGCEILAEYPNSLLVRCTSDQQKAMQDRGLEVEEIEEPAIQIMGMAFDFDNALEAERVEPTTLDPDRAAYYLVKLIGPAKGEWLDEIRGKGGAVHGNLPGYCLLVGILPDQVELLRQSTWVESVMPYRPAMKISPKLRSGVRANPSATELASLDLADEVSDSSEQVEISVFPGESIAPMIAEIKNSGGEILSESPNAVAAIIPTATIAKIAKEQSVQAILPHSFPELHNDRAKAVMGVPADNDFGGFALRGRDQIIAIADSGLDSGDPLTIHSDFRGRVLQILSLPRAADLSPFVNNPELDDDDPADTNSGHGTHVAGSVLGDGAAALAAGSENAPLGVAPEAQVYFQAIEKRINWKSAAQLQDEGIPVPINWPPRAVGLYGLPGDLRDLFEAAYAAGARIHTNSWGAANAGLYNETSRAVDDFMWNHRDMLILFSAGNSGRDLDRDGSIDRDSIGTPGTAKNCLTVGASENNRPADSTPSPGLNGNWTTLVGADGLPRYPALGAAGHISDNADGMAAFSSRGPTDDGRIKPDLVAPGTNILSTRSSAFATSSAPLWGDLGSTDPLRGLYCWSGGTSMSTPLVAGAAALIRQYLIERRGHFEDGAKPSGALVKAFLINGAELMPGQFTAEIPAGQNFVNGFGRVNLAQSMGPEATRQPLFFDEPDLAVETLQSRAFKVRAVDDGRPMKVTLVWTDAPSLVGNTGGRLKNRLYLQVLQADMTIIGGDVTPLHNPTNNVQQVIIRTPVEGTYEIRVRGVEVIEHSPGVNEGPNPRQDFALVISNAEEILT